jgi:hypothetical protein
MDPAAMIAPWPTINRGTDATVDGQLALARLGDELLVRRAERDEIERIRAFDDRHDQKPRPVLALRIDRQPEMNAGFDALRLPVFAAERGRHRRLFFRGLHDRIGDEMREADLFAATGCFERSIERRAPRFERADPERPKRCRRWYGERRIHIAGQRTDGTLEFRNDSAWRQRGKRDRRRRPLRLPVGHRQAIARCQRAIHVFA